MRFAWNDIYIFVMSKFNIVLNNSLSRAGVIYLLIILLILRRRPNLLLCEIFQQEYELGESRMSEDECSIMTITI